MVDYLYENEHYTVERGMVYVDESRSIPGYHAVNRQTKIVEFEDTVLPQVIGFANGASQHLDELFADARASAH